MNPAGLIDDYNQISRWSKYLDLTWGFISSYETQAREEYGIPFPLSWVAVLASFGALLYMFTRVRKWMAPPPGEPLLCNRTDVDDLSAQILMIRSLKDKSFGTTPAAIDLSAIDAAFDQVETKMQEISDRQTHFEQKTMKYQIEVMKTIKRIQTQRQPPRNRHAQTFIGTAGAPVLKTQRGSERGPEHPALSKGKSDLV